jgi:hypothetical protein
MPKAPSGQGLNQKTANKAAPIYKNFVQLQLKGELITPRHPYTEYPGSSNFWGHWRALANLQESPFYIFSGATSTLSNYLVSPPI